MEQSPIPQIPQLRFRARLASCPADLAAASRLRAQAFLGGKGGDLLEADCDAFDAKALHLLVEDVTDGSLAGVARLLVHAQPEDLLNGYSAQFYNLEALARSGLKTAELGRFCTDPARRDPDILRLIWGGLAALVARENISLLCGCSSFKGQDWQAYRDALAHLRAHLTPEPLRAGQKSPRALPYARLLARHAPDPKRALSTLPQLLRSYLMLGGTVSDHAVLDPDLDTFHVFTALDIRAIPPARARLLQATPL